MWAVEFYNDARGKCPDKACIHSLPVKEQAKAIYVLQLLEQCGTLLRQPHANYIDDGLWELRAGPNRLFYFLFTGKTFIVLHGFRKKTQKTPRKEIATAKRRRDEYLGS